MDSLTPCKTHRFSEAAAVVAIFLLTLAATVFALTSGDIPVDIATAVNILKRGPANITEDAFAHQAIWTIRLPRLSAAFLAGAVLSLSALSISAVFRSKLFTPTSAGISAGAVFGSACGKLIGLDFSTIFAVCGGISGILITFLFGCRDRSTSMGLLLSGAATGAILTSAAVILMHVGGSSPQNIALSLSGDFSGAEWRQIFTMLLVFCVYLFFTLHFSDMLVMLYAIPDLAAFGVSRWKSGSVILAAATAAASFIVSFFGMMPFLGMFSSYVIYGLFGTINSVVIICCALLGGSLLSILDTLARNMGAFSAGSLSTAILLPILIAMLLLHKKASREDC